MATGVVSGSVALMIEAAKATYGAAPPVNAITGECASQASRNNFTATSRSKPACRARNTTPIPPRALAGSSL